MIDNINKFIYGIKKRGTNSKGSIYAQIIKGERAKQHKTLEEVAKGICSVSYLCKMENYSIDPPMNFVKVLFEKMNLDYDSVSDDDFECSLNNALCYYYEGSDKLDEMVEKVLKFNSSPTIKLIICLYNLKHCNFKELMDEITYLDEIKDTLGGLEALCLVYVVLKYYIDNSLFSKSYNYLKCLDFIEVENKYLKYLLLDANLITSFNMKNYFRFITFYNRTEMLDYSGYSLNKKITAKMMLNIFKSEEYKHFILDEVDGVNCFDIDVIYYQLIVKIKCGLFDNVFEFIYNDNNIKNDSRFIGLMAYCAYKTNNKEYFQMLLDFTNNYIFKDNDEIHKNFVFFVLMNGYNTKELEIRDYLKREFIPKVHKVYNYLYDDIYAVSYLKLLGESSQYKEGFNFMLNYFNIVL